MTDPIKIPVVREFSTCSGERQQIDGYLHVANAIATQLVALTDLPARIAALETHACRVLDLHRRHLQNEMEQRHEKELTHRDNLNDAVCRERDRLRRDLLDIAEGCKVGVSDEAEAKRRIIAIAGERDRLAAQVASLVGPDGINYCAKIEAARDKARAELAEARKEAAGPTWAPETCRQVIARTTALVEFIVRRDGPDGSVTMCVHDVVVLRDLARAALAKRAGAK